MERIPKIAVSAGRSNEKDKHPLSQAKAYNLCCKIRRKTKNDQIYYTFMKKNIKSKEAKESFVKDAVEALYLNTIMTKEEARKFIDDHL